MSNRRIFLKAHFLLLRLVVLGHEIYISSSGVKTVPLTAFALVWRYSLLREAYSLRALSTFQAFILSLSLSLSRTDFACFWSRVAPSSSSVVYTNHLHSLVKMVGCLLICAENWPLKLRDEFLFPTLASWKIGSTMYYARVWRLGTQKEEPSLTLVVV